MTLKLYEIGNGWMGESYMRVYVFATNDDDALALARAKFVQSNKEASGEEYYQIGAVVDVVEGYVSEPADFGLENGKRLR